MSADRMDQAGAPLRRWRQAPEDGHRDEQRDEQRLAGSARTTPADDRGNEASGTWSAEDRAAALFRRAALPAEPDPIRLELIRRRMLTGSGAAGAAAGSRPAWSRGRWATILALLAFSGVSLAGYAIRRLQGPAPAEPRSAVSVGRGLSAASIEPATPASPPALPPPAAATTVLVVPAEKPAARVPPAPRRASARPGGETREPGWSEETRLLLAATTRLRQRADAAGALADLEALLRLHPRGVLAPEARALQIEALLAAGRRDEALRALDAVDLQASPRGLELRLLRAELRARGSCARALDDFATVLRSSSLPRPLLERALRGRAACHLSLGNTTAARADLRLYLDRLPDGRYAAEVRRLLEASAPTPR
jgi:tetratricopeptide (TPR) repeat protein